MDGDTRGEAGLLIGRSSVKDNIDLVSEISIQIVRERAALRSLRQAGSDGRAPVVRGAITERQLLDRYYSSPRYDAREGPVTLPCAIEP